VEHLRWVDSLGDAGVCIRRRRLLPFPMEKEASLMSFLYEKAKRRPLPKKLREKLDRKRREGTITSHDLPGALQREFPRELEGWTLEQIREVCSRPVVV
jgi:hypothetical protein